MKKKLSILMILIFITSVFGMANMVQAQDEGPYELDFWYSPSHYGSTEADVADTIRSQLEGTGYFDVNVESAEWTQYVGQFSTMGFFLLGWWFDYPDPSNYIDPFVGSGAFSLGTNYTSDTMDEHIETMLTDPDLADRVQAQEDAQNLMAEDVPLIPLMSMIKQFSGYQSGIEGFNLEPSENVHYDTITDANQDNDGVISIGVTDSITSLDPADAYDYFSSNVLVQLTHGLMEMPRDSTTAEPGPMVESVDVNDNADVYTFNLKDDWVFSDGTPFNATAMKWNLERSIELNGDPGFLLSSVLNGSKDGSSITVVDENTLKLELLKPDATFLQRLTYTVAWPVSPNSMPMDDFSGQPGAVPAGLGPYMVDTWSEGTEITLVPNPHYNGTAPANDEINILFHDDASGLLTSLEDDAIDIAQKQFGPDEIESIQDNDNLEWVEKETAGIRYLIVNVEEHTDKRVRQAMAAAIDRQEITESVFAGLNDPLYSMVPEIFDSSIKAFSDGTTDEVASLMQAAGYSTSEEVPIASLTTAIVAILGTFFVVNIFRSRKIN